MAERSAYQQFADLCCLPGGLGHPRREEIDPRADGHHWIKTPARAYACSTCGMRSHDPRLVILDCATLLAERLRREEQARRIAQRVHHDRIAEGIRLAEGRARSRAAKRAG